MGRLFITEYNLTTNKQTLDQFETCSTRDATEAQQSGRLFSHLKTKVEPVFETLRYSVKFWSSSL